MHRSDLLNQLEIYRTSSLITPYEQSQLKQFEQFIKTNVHCFERSNTGHITSQFGL